jgi:hypothetical protein
MKTYYGKYGGKVESNQDPKGLGRLLVSVPEVLGHGNLCWAFPCTPFAGNDVGLFLLPPEGASVWVEFEGGNTNRRAIWSGCFWEMGQKVPAEPPIAQMKVFKTQGLQVALNELPGVGGLTLTVSNPIALIPIEIKLSPAGIEISNGATAKIKLTSMGVNINDGALEVV